MSTVNLTRNSRFNEKRDISVFAARIRLEDIPTSADEYQVFKLPANSLVIDTNFTVLTPFDSATSADVDIGVGGGAQFLADGDATAAAGTTETGVVPNVWRPTGGVVTVTPTYTGATTEGEILVIIEYVEVEKVTGHITSYVG